MWTLNYTRHTTVNNVNNGRLSDLHITLLHLLFIDMSACPRWLLQKNSFIATLARRDCDWIKQLKIESVNRKKSQSATLANYIGLFWFYQLLSKWKKFFFWKSHPHILNKLKRVFFLLFFFLFSSFFFQQKKAHITGRFY